MPPKAHGQSYQQHPVLCQLRASASQSPAASACHGKAARCSNDSAALLCHRRQICRWDQKNYAGVYGLLLMAHQERKKGGEITYTLPSIRTSMSGIEFFAASHISRRQYGRVKYPFVAKHISTSAFFTPCEPRNNCIRLQRSGIVCACHARTLRLVGVDASSKRRRRSVSDDESR